MLITKAEYSSNHDKLVIDYNPTIASKSRVNFLMAIVQPIISGIMKVVVQPFLDAVKPILQTFLSFIADALAMLFPELPDAVDSLIDIIKDIINIGKDLFSKVVDLMNSIKDKVMAMKDRVVSIVKEFGSTCTSVFSSIGDDITQTFNSIKNKIKSAYNTLTEFIKIPNVFQNFNIADSFTNVVVNIWNMIKSVGSAPIKLFNYVMEIVEGVKTDVVTTSDNTVDTAKSLGDTIIKQADSDLTKNITTYVTTSQGTISKQWDNCVTIKDNVTGKISDYTSGTNDTSQSLGGTIKSVIGTIVHEVTAFFKNAFNTLKNIGSGLIDVITKVSYYGQTYWVVIPLVITTVAGGVYIGYNMTQRVLYLEQNPDVNAELLENDRRLRVAKGKS